MIHRFYQLISYIRRRLQRSLNTATVGVKALIINQNQEVLLVEHTYMSGWHLPGGGVEPGETPKAAIIREVKEETGLLVKDNPALFAIYAHQIMGASDYPMLYIIKDFAHIPGKLSGEIKQARWFGIHSLPAETTESTRQRISEYLHNLPPAEHW
jgi:ADP-ribose pyrophosphatase YjhB (NUDIX family)